MLLTADGDGGYRANGVKYYIGNGNAARMVSTFGKFADSGEYVFFAADSHHPNYELIGNVVNSQIYVSTYALHDYPVNEANILHRGEDAWNAALNTVNVGKYNLGCAGVGLCTHAFYEAINHAANRVLYGRTVTDFPHVRRLFTGAYARLVAMKLVTARAGDYMRTATREDRRYLLYNPLVKARVTSEGEKVLTDLWDVIAAKGMEKDSFFEAAARDIRWLPRLEGTVHVNTALMVKFMPNYLFAPDESLPAIGVADEPVNDDFLFDQGPTRGLGKIKFRDYRLVLDGFTSIPNVAAFRGQVDAFVALVAGAPPSKEQQDDVDFSLAMGQLFSLLVYAGLVLEAAPTWGVADELLDEMFGGFVRIPQHLAGGRQRPTPVRGCAHHRTMRRASRGGQPRCTSRATWCQSRWSAQASASVPGTPSPVSRSTRQLCTSSSSRSAAWWLVMAVSMVDSLAVGGQVAAIAESVLPVPAPRWPGQARVRPRGRRMPGRLGPGIARPSRMLPGQRPGLAGQRAVRAAADVPAAPRPRHGSLRRPARRGRAPPARRARPRSRPPHRTPTPSY